jgi:two-component SAPR family response regulator
MAHYSKVLLIDDDDIDIYISRRIISDCGFADQVISKDNTDDAMSFLKGLEGTPENIPDLIFLDISLAGKNSLTFLNEMQLYNRKLNGRFKIAILSDMLPYEKSEAEKIRRHPIVLKVIEKPLTINVLNSIAGCVGLQN